MGTNPTAYLFIDGGYLRKRYTDALQRVFGEDGEIDVNSVRSWIQGRFGGHNHPRRVFYYDCLHDIKLEAETDAQFKVRVEKQEAELQRIQSLPGFHVHRGRLTGRPGNIRQKGVDVLLAVEMLDHAFRKNMDEAWLLAGDADFVPLVEAVTRLGTWVNVLYDPRSAPKDLYAAADQGIPLAFNDIYSWSTANAANRCRLPEQVDFGVDHRASLAKSETIIFGKDQSGNEYVCGQNPGSDFFIFSQNLPSNSTAYRHRRADVLKNYCNELFGTITWG